MEKISGEVLAERFGMSLESASFRLEDGSVIPWLVFHRREAVAIMATYENAEGVDQIILVNQPRPAVANDHCRELPAGVVDPGEDRLDAAKREMAEEIGYAADSWECLGTICASPGYSTELITLYRATGLREVPRPPADDSDRVSVEHHPLRELLSLCSDAKTLACLALAQARS